MKVRVHKVHEDKVELIFDPAEGELRVGESLTLTQGERGLVAQILKFKSFSHSALLKEELSAFGNTGLRQLSFFERNSFRDLMLAEAKIRKKYSSGWEKWDGWIPIRSTKVVPLEDREVMNKSIKDFGNRIYLGRSAGEESFPIEGQNLEKVNVICGAKGSGKSHLAKVLLLQLISLGAPCIVFDINKEYVCLPRDINGKEGIIVLEAGRNLKLGIRDFGLEPLMTMITRFGLPEASAIYFENRLSDILSQAESLEKKGRKAPFLGINELIEMADEGEFYKASSSGRDAVNEAIKSRLEALRNTGIFAQRETEAISMKGFYQRIREGGGLIVDVSGLSNLARSGFVRAILDILIEICREEARHNTCRFPFIFFEEAHLYVQRNTLDFLVSRARHIGATLFLLTNMVTGLDEAVLRQLDNLFIFELPLEEDIRYISKSAMVDEETIFSLVRRLKQYHSLVIGEVSNFYPLILKVDPLSGINTLGETKFFFQKCLS